MPNRLFIFLISILPILAFGASIKDLTDVRGFRSNQLYGYGIVTGLNGQGDSRIEYTELGILNALESLGIRADKADKSRNIAAVMITTEIGPLRKKAPSWMLRFPRLEMQILYRVVFSYRLRLWVLMVKSMLFHKVPFR